MRKLIVLGLLLLVCLLFSRAQDPGSMASRAKCISGQMNCQMAEVVTASATLDFPSQGGGLCTDLTISVPGAAMGDPVIISHPTSGTRGMFDSWVSSTDIVTVRHCSINGTNDPPSASYKASVHK